MPDANFEQKLSMRSFHVSPQSRCIPKHLVDSSSIIVSSTIIFCFLHIGREDVLGKRQAVNQTASSWRSSCVRWLINLVNGTEKCLKQRLRNPTDIPLMLSDFFAFNSRTLRTNSASFPGDRTMDETGLVNESLRVLSITLFISGSGTANVKKIY
ncbi:hypothetical protein J6590_081867 [Homalodisca vitripennis]|nr:hypothetical protein J6590_081867 [Homalodisca vitripennis]